MKHHLTIGCLCLLLVFSGCVDLGLGPDPQMTYDGTLNVTEDGFEMEGGFYMATGHDQQYDNVTLYLYDANGSVINSKRLGAFDDGLSVEMQSKQVPTYVIIDSPEFWDKGPLGVPYFERREGNGTAYIGDLAGSRDELPLNHSR